MSKKHSSPHLTAEMAAKIKHLGKQGYMQHDIAARFGINQGRVCEVLKGKRFPDVQPDGKPPEDPQPELPF